MKKILLSLVLITIALTIFAQAPQAFKYQAIVRDNVGDLLTNQLVSFRISIHDGSAGGAIVYQETHNISTNQFGLATLEIGNGTPVIGTFSAIDWGSGTKHMRNEIDPTGGNNYSSMGTKQLVSVPYALYAESANICDDGDWTVSGNDMFSNITGDVGIGTSTPDAALHVSQNNGVLFDGTYGSGTSLNLGAGTRLMWYPKKAAFRSGEVNGSQWNDANIGNYSSAIGWNTTASGYYSTAMGALSTANGFCSTALGNGTEASGFSSVATGAISIASGDCSTAMGYGTVASGDSSTAMGYGTTADGNSSTAMGYFTKAESFNSTAIGMYNTGGGTAGSWVDTDPIFEIGNGTDDINRANAVTVLKNGKVGLGKSSPSAALDVNGEDGVLFTGIYGSGNLPASGAGIRMMWYPGKAAFRAGQVWGTQWDNANIGDNSIALGYGTTASGSGSVALGANTTASNGGSTAMGYVTSANGIYSTAMGWYTIAGGISSTAMGQYTTASGSISTAMGRNTIASGGFATSMGEHTNAESYISTAIGRFNTGGGTAVSWVDTDPLFEIGNGTDDANRSNAVTVLKNGKVGIGTTSPDATLDVNGEEGVLFTGNFESGTIPASGTGIRMMWYPKKAAFRAGYVGGTQWDDTNIGVYSLAAGFCTTASGLISTALGFGTKAESYISTAFGVYNVGGGLALYWNDTDPLFEIGNGTDDANRSNAMTVLKNGNVGIGTVNPDKKLDVDYGNILVQGTNSFQTSGDAGIVYLGGVHHYIKGEFGFGVKIGAYNATDAVSIKENTGRVGIGTTTPGRKLWVNGDAGGATGWYNDSDVRLKKNINTIDDPLEKVLKLRGVNFEWNDNENHTNGIQMGLIAQEAKKIIPEVVDKKGEYYSMQYAPVIALLIEAIKEQQTIIKDQDTRIKKLEKEIGME